MFLNFKCYQLILIMTLPFGVLAFDKVGGDKRRPDSPRPRSWHLQIVDAMFLDPEETISLLGESFILSKEELIAGVEKPIASATPAVRAKMIARIESFQKKSKDAKNE